MTNKNEEKAQHTYRVSGMHCGGCANTVQRKLSELTAVKSVKVDLVNKQAVIVSDTDIKLSDLQRTLGDTNYSISELNSESKLKP